MTDDRLRYLDGLRGILAIIVFLHHFVYVFYPDMLFGGPYTEFLKTRMTFNKLVALTPLNMLFNPGMAIQFFFILSGYVQCFHYFKKPDLLLVQKSFLKRYFRLAVPTLSVLLLVYSFHKLHFITKELIPPDPVTGGWSANMLPDKLNFLSVVKHGLLDVFISNFRYYQVLWTMPIELMNSWMVLIFLFVTHQIRNKVGLIIFWLLVQLFLIQSYYSAAFTFGMLICYGEVNSPKFSSFFSKGIVKLLALLVGIYFASYPFIGYEKSTETGFYSLISFFEKYPHIISYLFGDLLLFCFLLRSETMKNILTRKIFLFFGNISFMLYLLHLLIIFSFSPWLYHALSTQMSRSANLLITGSASFLLITILSQVFYQLLDKPILTYCNIYFKKFFAV
jgi:peptidoglycan/LPS O-acetylase OafA/YrhL